MNGLTTTLEDAEKNGAMTCAPRELAIGKSELEFAEIDLDQGQFSNAQEHLAKAEPNAQAAFSTEPGRPLHEPRIRRGRRREAEGSAGRQGHRRRRHRRLEGPVHRSSPRTSTATSTTTAAPIPTTTATASPTTRTSARTTRRTSTATRTTTAAPTRTTTATPSPTSTTSARTRRASAAATSRAARRRTRSSW